MSTPQRDPPSLQAPNGSPYTAPRRSMDAARSPIITAQSPSTRTSSTASAASQHRSSISEHRYPSSPRSHRQPSLTQLAVQELIDNPPVHGGADTKFNGRDWRTVKVGELIDSVDLKFVDVDTPVEAATNLLIESGAPAIIVREKTVSSPIVGLFDYTTLNTYLLLVVGLAHPTEDKVQDFNQLAAKAREGKPIPLKDVKDLGRKEPLTFLSESADLMKAIETFGRGVHRALVTKEGTQDVVGVLSQSRLVKFLWENGRSFPAIDQLYTQYLRDLRVGSNDVVAVNGDRPLSDALTLMSEEGISSLAVVDNANNVVGNISTVDTRLLTKTSSLPLLRNTCIHFISVILSTRGMYEGKDSFPVFHVTPLNTLAHTVAKLVATKSHRMWITEPISPSSSGPPTPSIHPSTMVPLSTHNSSISAGSGQSFLSPPLATTTENKQLVADSSPKTPSIAPSGPSVSASSLPGARISGSLVGVVSLTDILILFAKAGGMSAADPNEVRFMRRRSSSSSVRRSMDQGSSRSRPSMESARKTSYN